MRRIRQALASLLLLALYACGSVDPQPTGALETRQEAWVTIANNRIPVELAITREEQKLGLGERDHLEWGHGMLFIHEKPDFRRYWMKGMRFDIDIIWIRDGRISEIAHAVPHVPGENGPQVGSSELVDQVLEVPAGYSMTQGWRKGQRVQVEYRDPSP